MTPEGKWFKTINPKKTLIAWMEVHGRVEVGLLENPYGRVRSGI